MGIVSSMRKCKKQGTYGATVHNNDTKTVISTANTSSSMSSEKARCSVLNREPRNSSLFRYHYYLPSKQQIYSTTTNEIRGHRDFSLFSRPFYLPFNGKNHIAYYHSNPYVAQANNHKDDQASSLIYSTNCSRGACTTGTTDHPQLASSSNIIQAHNDEHRKESHRTLVQVEASMKMDKNEQASKTTIDEEFPLVQRSVSTPIDMFLIDISNEHVCSGQPISMNIRHLLLDTLENRHGKSLTPIRLESTPTTTYARENLLNYIPRVCERYPNVTVAPDQITRNTLHLRISS